MSSRTELRAFLYSERFSIDGRSEATAIIIPNTVETIARIASAKSVSPRRSLLSWSFGGYSRLTVASVRAECGSRRLLGSGPVDAQDD